MALTTLNASVLSRELAPLRAVSDNFSKYLLTLDDLFGDENHDGIVKKNVIAWLPEDLGQCCRCADSAFDDFLSELDELALCVVPPPSVLQKNGMDSVFLHFLQVLGMDSVFRLTIALLYRILKPKR